MSYTPGSSKNDDYAPLTREQIEAGLDAIDRAQRPWWRRVMDWPCYAASVLRQQWARVRGVR